MVDQNLSVMASDWQEQAAQYFRYGDYLQAAKLYEAGINVEPNVKSYYWHLGLIWLLQGQEAEAQTTWLLAMAEGSLEEIEQWTEDLVQVLQTEAERRRLELADYSSAWLIRQHIREVNPNDINNLLHLIGLSTLLGRYTGDELNDLGIIELLNSEAGSTPNCELLLQVWKNVLEYPTIHQSSLDFTEACLPYVKESLPFLDILIEFVYEAAYSAKHFVLATRFTELGLRLEPKHPELLRTLSSLYQDICEYSKGIETAKLCYSVIDNLADKVYANHLIMRGLMSAGGYWDEFCSLMERHKSLVASLNEEQPSSLNSSSTIRLFSSCFFFPYFQDSPEENGLIRSQIGQICQINIEKYAKDQVERYRQKRFSALQDKASNKRLKIGYISYCLRKHSVGHLARWLFQYHNHERFEINTYLLSSGQTDDPLQKWYISKSDQAYKLGLDSSGTADLINKDDIDILIDLDSLTLNNISEIMAMKPAPIQATWLGWDASGVPAIDYYIADPYVLPESAQEYYTEKIGVYLKLT